MFFFKNKFHKEAIARIKREDLELNALFTTINNRNELENLLKNLSRRCHPDAYANNPQKMAIAEDLFKKVRANSTNYVELLKIERIISEQLES